MPDDDGNAGHVRQPATRSSPRLRALGFKFDRVCQYNGFYATEIQLAPAIEGKVLPRLDHDHAAEETFAALP